MTTTAPHIAEAATLLHNALLTRQPIAPVTDLYPGLDVTGAYAIQQTNLARRLADGGVVVGHKIGLTSEPMQKLLGVDEPDFGYILNSMVVPDGAIISAADFCAPRVEPEVAFLLHSPLRGPGVTVADVLAATKALAPALEIVDSRIADWKVTLEDTIADNASSAAVVLGPWMALADSPDPVDMVAALEVNGTTVDTGTGRAVMGDPAAAIAWLANSLAAFDITIEAGQFVMSGSFTSAVFVHPGDHAVARLGGLGDVSVTFK